MGHLFTTHKLQHWLKSCVVACALSSLTVFVYAADEIAFVIDTSGSMVKNDPKNLRKPALKLATQMLPGSAKASVWLFDDDAQQIIPFGTVDKSWKNSATKATSKVNSKGMFTNIEKALESSAAAFSADADSKTIILLTDGRVDISKNTELSSESRNKILNTLLPSLNKQNIQIHTIALSDNTDKDLLQRLSVGSNGMYSLAGSADDLMSIFLQVFDQSIASDQVPLEENKFTIDPSIKEFTVLVFRKTGSKPLVLHAPNGQQLIQSNPGSAQWFSDDLYDLVTVSTPAPGQWLLDADIDPENRVTIISNLELNLRGLPNNIIQGQQVTLEFFLSDEDGTISAPTLLSLLDIDFEQKILTEPPKVLKAKVSSYSQGLVRTPSNGIFSAKLSKTLANGENEFSVYVDGKTFKRTQTKRARVLSQVMEHTIIQGEGDQYQVNIVPINGLTQTDSLEITASIKRPGGQIHPASLEKTKFGSWVMNVPPEDGKQLYKAFITIKGKAIDGDNFEVTQGPIEVDYSKSLPSIQSAPAADLFDTLDKGNDEQEIKEVEKTLAPETKPEISVEKIPVTEKNPASSPQTGTTTTEKPQDKTVQEEPNDKGAKPVITDNKEKTDHGDTDKKDSKSAYGTPADQPESHANERSSDHSGIMKYVIYGAIALANLVLIGGGVYLGRRWFKLKKAEADAEDQALLNTVNEAKNKATEKLQNKTEVTASVDPAIDENALLTAEANKLSDMLDSVDDQDETA